MAGVTFREVLYALKLKCVLVWDEIKKLEMRKNEIGLSAQCVLKTGKFSRNLFSPLFILCVFVCVCAHAHAHACTCTQAHVYHRICVVKGKPQAPVFTFTLFETGILLAAVYSRFAGP